MKYQKICIEERRKFAIIIKDLSTLGLNYMEITREMEEYDIEIDYGTVRLICMKYNLSNTEEKEKGSKFFKALYNMTNGDVTYSNVIAEIEKRGILISQRVKNKIYAYALIYEYKKQHMTYTSILEELKKQNLNISYADVRNVCFEIYELEPDLKKGYMQNAIHTNAIDKQIFDLRTQKLSYKRITEILNSQGINLSRQRIEQRYKRYISRI